MPKVRTGLTRWLLLAGLLCSSSCQSVSLSFENKTGPNESRPRVFSPRMDYDEWTPLGRGDPLKNDPTFDYVPPVLDRVQYWLDSHTTEASAKRDILVLGVTAKKTSPKIPEQFLKFIDGPKFNRNQEQYRNEPTFHRNDFTGSTGAEPPKVIRTTSFRNGIIDYRNQNRIQNIPANYYPNTYYNQKPKPYTMMLPPPIIQKPIESPQSSYSGPQKEKVTFSIDQSQQFGTQTEEGPILQSDQQIYSFPPKSSYSQPHPPTRSSSKSPAPPKSLVSQIESIKSVYTPPVQNMKQMFETTTPSVSFEKSNLIYHSTQTLSGGWLASNGPSSSPELNQVTWQTPTNLLRDHYETGDHNVAASSNHEVVIGQNANIIVDGDSNENEEVVIGQKEQVDLPKSPEDNVQSSMMMMIANSDHSASADVVGQSSGSKMHIVMANTPAVNATAAENQSPNEPVAVVMPANYMDKSNVTMSDRGTMITVDGSRSSFNVTRGEIGSNTMTSEIEQTIQISNPVPPRNVLANPAMSSLRHEDSRQPSRTVPSHVAMHQAPRPSTLPLFGLPNGQQLVQQQVPMPQLHSNHVMMQYMPNMRPNVGPHMTYRPQMSMSHVPPSPSPPSMTHMQHGHANVPPPPKSMIGPHISMDQGHQQKPAQPPVMFTGPLASSPPIMTPQTNRRPQAPEHQGHRVFDGQLHMPILPTILPPSSTAETIAPNLEPVTDYAKLESTLAKILSNETKKTVQSSFSVLSTSSPPSSSSSVSPTTTVPSLTTDPIFSHYKQPAKPIRGPMYLIIQGHSKVKTYKPSVNKHGVPVERNEIQENTTKYLSKLEQLINENTKSVTRGEKNIAKKETEAKLREKRIGQESLVSLVDSGFSAFTVPPPPATEEERQSNSVTTIEINN